jgi:diaminopimelate decarboxylase
MSTRTPTRRSRRGRAPTSSASRSSQAAAAYEAASKYPNITIKGIQMHIGSQITEVGPFVEAVEKVAPLAAELKERYGISYISIGGGIGVVYKDALASGPASWWDGQPEDQAPADPRGLRRRAGAGYLKKLGLKILLEPGRSMVANAGVLLTRVEYLKRGAGERTS